MIYLIYTTYMEANNLTLANIIMIVGIFVLILSFLIKDRTKKIEKDVEDLSINIYQETNAIKRRLKLVEEELLLDVPPVAMSTLSHVNKTKAPLNQTTAPIQPINKQSTVKPVHSILVSQVLELGKQGMSVPEIQKRSALSMEQIVHILKNGGM